MAGYQTEGGNDRHEVARHLHGNAFAVAGFCPGADVRAGGRVGLVNLDVHRLQRSSAHAVGDAGLNVRRSQRCCSYDRFAGGGPGGVIEQLLRSDGPADIENREHEHEGHGQYEAASTETTPQRKCCCL